MNPLYIDNLTFERNQHLLFKPLSFGLDAGEMLQIQGANGSGKSTLLRLLAGFIEPHSGAIHWQNQSIKVNKENYQQQIHYLGHSPGIKSQLTVWENIQLYCALAGIKPSKSELQSTLAQLHLISLQNRLASQLSAGQLQRLSLSKLLLKKAALWLLDEPTTALDTEGQQFLFVLLKEHLKNKGLVILATHQKISFAPSEKWIELGVKNA